MENYELIIENLRVEIDGKTIIKKIDLQIPKGQTHILFGPNGCGKTTLLMTIMGFPAYKVTRGTIYFKGKDITNLPMDERARLGIGVSFQKPPTVKGVTLSRILREINGMDSPLKKNKIAELNMGDYLSRDLNQGFSGGEIKRSEMLQLAHQNPDLILMDEPESGVDIENLKIIGRIAKELLQKNLDTRIRDRVKMGLIITHTGYILDYVNADMAYIMIDGEINCKGNPVEIFQEIQQKGFRGCMECLNKR